MGVSSANCVSGFPLPLSFPKPTGSVPWEAFHPLSLAVRALRGFGFRFWTFPLGCSIAATRPPFFPMGFASMRFLRPKLSPSWGSVDSALRNAFPFPNSRWIWNRALQTFGSWGHPVGCRWTENPCVPVFLRGPSFPGASAPLSSVSAYARRNSAPRVSEKAGLWKKSSRHVFCLVSRGPPPRLCRHCARGGDLSAMPVSFNCRVLPIFWMLRPARFPGLCPCAFRPSRPRRKSSDFRVSS